MVWVERGRRAARGDPLAGPAFEILGESGPLVATAVHPGHVVRAEVGDLLAVTDDRRRYEEDPYTDRWAAAVGDVALVVHRSRFEVDFDRPREAAVLRSPDEAWGNRVWTRPPPEELVARSLALHDAFYAALESVIVDAVVRFGRFALLDLHAFNHRREAGRDAVYPDVDVGTDGGALDRFGRALGVFAEALADQEVDGAHLDVRRNARPGGGHLVTWVNERFGESGLAVSVAVKKIHMDEHTGELFPAVEASLEAALASAARELVADLVRV